jgi:hypothetical protein
MLVELLPRINSPTVHIPTTTNQSHRYKRDQISLLEAEAGFFFVFLDGYTPFIYTCFTIYLLCSVVTSYHVSRAFDWVGSRWDWGALHRRLVRDTSLHSCALFIPALDMKRL